MAAFISLQTRTFWGDYSSNDLDEPSSGSRSTLAVCHAAGAGSVSGQRRRLVCAWYEQQSGRILSRGSIPFCVHHFFQRAARKYVELPPARPASLPGSAVQD